jgi:hypothetical protein
MDLSQDLTLQELNILQLRKPLHADTRNKAVIHDYFHYIGDTVLNGKSFPDVYLIELPESHKGILQKMIFSVTRGVIEYKAMKGNNWIREP